MLFDSLLHLLKCKNIPFNWRFESTHHAISPGIKTCCPVITRHHPCSLYGSPRKECCQLPVEQVFIAKVLRCHNLLISPRSYNIKFVYEFRQDSESYVNVNNLHRKIITNTMSDYSTSQMILTNW